MARRADQHPITKHQTWLALPVPLHGGKGWQFDTFINHHQHLREAGQCVMAGHGESWLCIGPSGDHLAEDLLQCCPAGSEHALAVQPLTKYQPLPMAVELLQGPTVDQRLLTQKPLGTVNDTGRQMAVNLQLLVQFAGLTGKRHQPG